MKKVLTLLCIIGFNSFTFSQDKIDDNNCASLLSIAEKNYGVVFNYSSLDIKEIPCPYKVPDSFVDFRKLLKEKSGLKFKLFKDNLWVVSKNYTHRIQVVNSQQTPINNANIAGKNVSSNFYGNIFINIYDLPIKIKLSHKDHFDETLKITNGTPEMIKVVLQPKPVDLPEVILNSLYTNSIYLNSNNHIQVKNRKMPLLAGQTQQDAFVSLLNLPQISTNVESVAELNIKGGVNDQNLVLWNGIRMFQNSHLFGLLSAFNENLIDKMTVIDNATPVEYGHGITSTIQLNNDDKIIDKNQYGLGLNNLSGQVFSRLALNENTELSLAFQRSFTDFYNSSTYLSYSDKAFRDTDLQLSENTAINENGIIREDDFYYRDAQFQLKKQIGNDLRINLQGIWYENSLIYQEKLNDQDNRTSNYNNENSAIGIDATYKLSPQDNFVFKSNYSKHESNGDNNTFSGNLNTQQSNSVENYFTQLYWEQINNQHRIKAGFDFQGSVVFNNFNNAVTEAFLNLGQVSNVYSGFGAYTFNKNKWRIYSGLKGVYYQRDHALTIEPRVNIKYKINKNFDAVVKGEVKSQNFKQIIDLDQNFLGIEKRRWIVSGDSISPPLQKASQIEAMLQWKFNKIGGYASVYARELSGISANDQRLQNQGQFSNLQDGNSRIIGALLHIYYKNKWLNSWLSYAHLNEKFIFDNRRFNGNNNLNHRFTFGNSINFKNWYFSLAINYHNGLPFTDIVENPSITENPSGLNEINFKSPNENTLPHYFRLDSSLQYQLKTSSIGDFKFSAGLINLTNEHNILRRNFRLNRVNNNDIQKIENVGLGFTANFGILWTL